MSKLREIIYYIIKTYPNKSQLTNARLTKLVYLSDWRNVLTQGNQISDICWIFNHYGPYVHDVQSTISLDIEFGEKLFITSINDYGSQYYDVCNSDYQFKKLTEEEKESIDYAIEKTKHLGFIDFVNIVYSTYPVRSSNKMDRLDLIQKKKQLEKNKQE